MAPDFIAMLMKTQFNLLSTVNVHGDNNIMWG